MIRILHRILDFAAVAGSVSVTAHPAAALAHLGQPRAARPTRRARRRSATPQPGQRRREGAPWALNDPVDGRTGSGGHGDEVPAAHAPERLTWLTWSAGDGSRRAGSVDGTLGLASGLDTCPGPPSSPVREMARLRARTRETSPARFTGSSSTR